MVLNNEITIKQGDCFNLLNEIDDKSVDMVLTDPPYCISRKTGFSHVKKGVQRFAVDMEFGDWDREEIDLVALSKVLYNKLKNGGTCIIFYDLWKLSYLADAMKSAGFVQLRQIIWEKTNPVPLNSKRNYLTNAREVAVLGVKGSKPTFHSEYDNGIYSYPIPRGRIHPTQKPLDLFIDLINKHSNPRELVIDPFLGGGTTANASLKTNRKFWGCELDEGYFIKLKDKFLIKEEDECLSQDLKQLCS